jgi:hypothetical protein
MPKLPILYSNNYSSLQGITKIYQVSVAKPRVLVAPLDWGLGHATRCIPIIKELLQAGYEVIIGCEGIQKNLLQLEFPFLRMVDLRGYRVQWSPKMGQSFAKIVFQIPKILIQIKRENRWLRQFLAEESLDLILSDNRYGLHSKGVLSVFITHQLGFYGPWGRWVDKKAAALQYRYINKFSLCWIPDFPSSAALAGELSHPEKGPDIATRYIGTLSRFRNYPSQPLVWDLLVLLSGPEPQRSRWEANLLEQLKTFPGKVLLLRGLPGQSTMPVGAPHIKIFNHLPTEELNQAIIQSALVLGRSGYSSIMDLVTLGKKCIFVPTPGQPEQEYLATYLYQNKIALRANQNRFDLATSLKQASGFPFLSPGLPLEAEKLLQAALEDLDKRLTQARRSDLG